MIIFFVIVIKSAYQQSISIFSFFLYFKSFVLHCQVGIDWLLTRLHFLGDSLLKCWIPSDHSIHFLLLRPDLRKVETLSKKHLVWHQFLISIAYQLLLFFFILFKRIAIMLKLALRRKHHISLISGSMISWWVLIFAMIESQNPIC